MIEPVKKIFINILLLLLWIMSTGMDSFLLRIIFMIVIAAVFVMTNFKFKSKEDNVTANTDKKKYILIVVIATISIIVGILVAILYGIK